jgi:hypothetical protein
VATALCVPHAHKQIGHFPPASAEILFYRHELRVDALRFFVAPRLLEPISLIE